MTERTYTLARPSGYRYTRTTIEAALTMHFGIGGDHGWSDNGKGGFLVPTAKGIFELRTLREAALFCVASAEKAHRLKEAMVPPIVASHAGGSGQSSG